MFVEITMVTYIRPAKCNVHIINVRKSTENVFGLVMGEIPKIIIVIIPWS